MALPFPPPEPEFTVYEIGPAMTDTATKPEALKAADHDRAHLYLGDTILHLEAHGMPMTAERLRFVQGMLSAQNRALSEERAKREAVEAEFNARTDGVGVSVILERDAAMTYAEALRAVATEAAAKFREYGDLHRAKLKDDGTDAQDFLVECRRKSDANYAMAARIEAVLNPVNEIGHSQAAPGAPNGFEQTVRAISDQRHTSGCHAVGHLDPSEFAVYDGDEFFAQVSGPREQAWGEAMNYASQCDEPHIEEIVRTKAPMGEVPPGALFPESSQVPKQAMCKCPKNAKECRGMRLPSEQCRFFPAQGTK